MERLQLLVGKLLFIGALIAALITATGALVFLIQHGTEPSQFYFFNAHQSHVLHYSSARGLIEIGLYTLVLTQVLRVALTAWLFASLRDAWFTGFSIFVLVILLAGLFS